MTVALLAGLWLLAAAAVPAAAQDIDLNNSDVRLGAEDPLTPQQERALKTRDDERREQAVETGASSIDTFTGPAIAPTRPSPVPQAPAAAAGAPAPPVKITPTPPAIERPDAPVTVLAPRRGVTPRRAPPAPTYESLHDQTGEDPLVQALSALLDTWAKPPNVVRIRYPAPREAARRADAAVGGDAPRPGTGIPKIAVGTALYGRTMYQINSDHPGPVLVEILEPPLAGAVASGRFETHRDRMTLHLTSLSWQGRTVPVDAWAVSLDVAGLGVETEIDRHYLSRVILPAAIRFAEGWLARSAEPERSVNIDNGEIVYTTARPSSRQAVHAGAAAAARTFGDVLLQDAPTRATLRIPQNTELAVMFARQPGLARSVPPAGANIAARPAAPRPADGQAPGAAR